MRIERQKQTLNTESEQVSLREIVLKISELWTYLLSKWLIILLFVISGAALGLSYAYLSKAVYTATTTFVLEDEKGSGGLGNLAGLASMAGLDIGGGGGGGIFQGDNILDLYKSRSMLQKTLLTSVDLGGKRQLLVDRYINFNKLREKWAGKPEMAHLQFSVERPILGNQFSKEERLKDSILGVIVVELNKNYLTVAKPDKKMSTIQVDVAAKDEFFAKAFNDELVKNVNEFYVSTKTKKTLQNVRILQEKTDSVRAVMNGAIYSAVAVADATPNLNPTRQVQRVAPAQRAQFSAETNKSILAEMVKNLELTKLSLLKETPLIQVIDQPIYPLTKKKIGRVEGLVFGGIIFGCLVCLWFIFKKIIRDILN
ncbi:hypothetical protein ACVWYG_003480 [Pedobacter sp. UYEF25]